MTDMIRDPIIAIEELTSVIKLGQISGDSGVGIIFKVISKKSTMGGSYLAFVYKEIVDG